MAPRTVILLLLLCAAAPAAAAPAAAKGGPPPAKSFKLRPGAEGQVCLECHGDFEQRLKKASVHTPVRSRNCAGCHNPHASAHGKLLAAAPTEICATCHPAIVPKDAKSAHRPVAEAKCVQCHDPHASEFKNNLVRGGNDLCAGCHEKLVAAATGVRHKHTPVSQGCTTCHLPHGSAKADALLKDALPGLCVGCHKTDKPAFGKAHMGYPVARARCTSCHDPHGSPNPGLLYDRVHPPVAKGQCSMCHEPPGSKTPFKTRQEGVALCRGCHSQKLTQFASRSRLHAPVAEGACLDCHGPHASKAPGLLKAGMVSVCGACHADTIRRQEVSPTKHKPVQEGDCTKCHDPHSGNVPLMLVNASAIDLCGTCHDWQKHSSHPLGEAKKDPRNGNLTLSCQSCHRAHGTEYAHMVPYAKTTELCTKCHEQFKR